MLPVLHLDPIFRSAGAVMERLNAWYRSAEYQPLVALRKQSTADADMIITLEGA
jgi:uncharacterized protein (DUF1330 family)